MKRPDLAATLTAMLDGVTLDHPFLSVEEAEIHAPLVVALEHGAEGPAFVAHPPWSRWRSGVEPVVHRMRVRVATEFERPLTEERAGRRASSWD